MHKKLLSKILVLLLPVAGSLSLIACGQKGPLYLPAPATGTPPAAAPASPLPAQPSHDNTKK